MVAIVKKSTLTSMDNWSAEFHVGAKKMIDFVIKSDLSSIEMDMKIKNNLGLLMKNRESLRISIKYKKDVIAAAISSRQVLTVDNIMSFFKSAVTGRDLYKKRRALVVSMVLMHSIQENKVEIMSYIDAELRRVSKLKEDMESIMSIPLI